MASLVEEITKRIQMDFGSNGSSRLPGERELAQKYRCSRKTIRLALGTLADAGHIYSIPRNGHFFKDDSSKLVDLMEVSDSTKVKADSQTILMVAFGDCMKDPNYMDLLAGAISEATKQGINLAVTELATSEFATIKDVLTLHRGLSVDGYIIGGRPPIRMKTMIEKLLRPTAIIGEFYHQHKSEKFPRFIQYISPIEAVYREVAQHLHSLGHKRLMLVFDTEGPFQISVSNAFAKEFNTKESDAVKITEIIGEIWDYTGDGFAAASKKLADRVSSSLDDQTALVVCGGAWLGLEIWKGLMAKNIRIPKDLSVIIGSGRADIFIEVFDIGTVFTNSWNVGVMCVQEIARQIKTQTLEYGIRWTPQSYVVGKTVGPAPDQE